MKSPTTETYFFRTLFVLLLTLLPPSATAAPAPDRTLDSLLREIDNAIDHSDEYVRKKTDRIGFLKTQLAQAKSPDTGYDISFQLYREYLPFVNDSAIYYLNRCASMARRMNDESRAGGCLSLIALSCSNAGLYPEAETVLKDIRPEQLHDTDLGLYYYAYGHVSGEIAYYGNFDSVRKRYAEAAESYRKQMMEHLPRDHKYSMQCREMMAYNSGDFSRSLAINSAWLHTVSKGTADYAIVAYYRYLEYKAKGDYTQMMRWLAESVISDVKNAVMDQGAMWEMANQLLVAGDVDRSYRYICFTSDCADRFGSRQRLSRISPLLSHIAQSYKTEADRKNNSLRHTVAAISVMSLLLLATLFYVYRKRDQLALTRDQLAQSNQQLTDSNSQLSSLNSQLSSLNSQLSSLNSQLSEANRVKEEYVGRFMRLCSMYVNRLDDLRKKVTKRVKNKQYGELAELTRSTEFKTNDADELYANFDTAFLHLFPSFVDEFNALLKPEHRVALTDQSSLNTVVRIFALIRLGITDSSKIAEFLHYSVNTIYNYRANIKNGALVDRAEFENRVKQIGLPKESNNNSNE